MVLALALNAVADTEGSDLQGGGGRRSDPAEGCRANLRESCGKIENWDLTYILIPLTPFF